MWTLKNYKGVFKHGSDIASANAMSFLSILAIELQRSFLSDCIIKI